MKTKLYLIDNKELMSEWAYEKNLDLDPKTLTSGSKKKAWWICTKGHEYKQAIDKRVIRKQGCPICSGHKAWKGVNDLETKFPELAKEWHPIKNGDLKPSEVKYGSGKKVWWKCDKCGVEWERIINLQRRIGKCHNCEKNKNQLKFNFPEI